MGSAVQVDCPAMRGRQFFDHRQADTATRGRSAGLPAVEAVPHKGPFFFWDPGPVSVTSKTASQPSRRTLRDTLPPVGVNFTALVNKLVTTCRSRCGSPTTKVGGKFCSK